MNNFLNKKNLSRDKLAQKNALITAFKKNQVEGLTTKFKFINPANLFSQ